ncbi:MAG: hypothetical protein VX589_00275, partial [Myxococcota bacterium]|nr:hypothetical protein [Myxococcota bacterium]
DPPAVALHGGRPVWQSDPRKCVMTDTPAEPLNAELPDTPAEPLNAVLPDTHAVPLYSVLSDTAAASPARGARRRLPANRAQ